MAAQTLANQSVFLLPPRPNHYTGRNFAPRTKNEKDSENIYKNEVNIVGFLEHRRKNGFDHFTIYELLFCSSFSN